ncbi:hypothetical protein [Paracoccus sp. N5]|uniref:hypothetical protein n=1 Tax=Paracoccus sp. N5 TaxID=1101189 RepID=UPI00036B656D|nr:hypothetical protein [Paracoccus sp. N5]
MAAMKHRAYNPILRIAKAAGVAGVTPNFLRHNRRNAHGPRRRAAVEDRQGAGIGAVTFGFLCVPMDAQKLFWFVAVSYGAPALLSVV